VSDYDIDDGVPRHPDGSVDHDALGDYLRATTAKFCAAIAAESGFVPHPYDPSDPDDGPPAFAHPFPDLYDADSATTCNGTSGDGEAKPKGKGKPSKFIDRHDYEAYLDAVRRRGNWCVLPLAWCRIFGTDVSALLSHLMSVGKARADGEGWVPVTPAFLKSGLGISYREQDTYLARLCGEGLIEVDQRAFKGFAVRHIRVNTHRLEQLVREGVCI
jgi:hypothetical protein